MSKSAFHRLYFPFFIPVSYQSHPSSLQVFSVQVCIALSLGVALISKNVGVCNLLLRKPLQVPFVGSEAKKAVQLTRYGLE